MNKKYDSFAMIFNISKIEMAMHNLSIIKFRFMIICVIYKLFWDYHKNYQYTSFNVNDMLT